MGGQLNRIDMGCVGLVGGDAFALNAVFCWVGMGGFGGTVFMLEFGDCVEVGWVGWGLC